MISSWKQRKGNYLQKVNGVGCVLTFILALLAGPAQAAVTYDASSLPVIVTTVTLSSIIDDPNQSNIANDIWAVVEGSSISVDDTATGVVLGPTDGNVLYSSVMLNKTTLGTDIALVTGSSAGSSLASVNAQVNYDVTAFSQISGSSVTSEFYEPADGSAASLSGNSISAVTSLNQTAQTVQGSLATDFDSSHDGTAVATLASPVVLSGDAGLFVGSAQTTVGATPLDTPDVELNYAEVANNEISMTVANTLSGDPDLTGESLALTVDDNSISASFTGNNAENLLAVETGGATSLDSSAGIANLQVNSGVTFPAGGSNASLTESGISVSVDTVYDDDPLVESSVSFDGNSLNASATGNVADNQLVVAENLNVAADGSQENSVDFDGETSTTSAGLFLNNVQLGLDSPIAATANGPAATDALSVDSRGLIDSAVSADGNSFEAIALGNDASSSLTVEGATTFDSTVAAQNVQATMDSPVTATASDGTLAVNLGGSPALVDVATNDIIGTSISVDDNNIGSLAVANRDPLLVNVAGTNVTDGYSGTAGDSIDYDAEAMASAAGISALSGQVATGSDVTADTTGAGINLAAAGFNVSTGAPGPHVSDATFSQTGNTIKSLANLNEGLVAVGVDALNLDASSAVVSMQDAAASNVAATTDGTITAGVNTRTTGTDLPATNIDMLVGGNTISSAAGGNLNASALEVAAETAMQVTGVIDLDGASSDSLNLSSNAAADNETFAEMSVLTDQRLYADSVSATTDASRIAGTIRISSSELSDSVLHVDGNQVAATARGNLTGNSLDFSALSVDMSAADTTAGAAGSNLAAMGAVQVLDEQSSVSATINAGADNVPLTNSEIQAFQAGSGDMTNFEISAGSNTVEAAATGNSASSSLSGSGVSLVEDVPSDLAGSLEIADVPTTALAVSDTAAANVVVQDTAGSVSASLAATEDYQITARTQANNNVTNYSKDVSNSVVSADNNRAVALATGSSADAHTRLAFTTLESSAATAVQQAQSGTTMANVGSDGGVTISAWTPVNTNLVNSTLSASGNTAGAQATGATATTSLAAGGVDTITLASGYSDAATFGADAAIAAAGGTSLSADYMLGMQQFVSGATSAAAYDLSVLAEGGNFAGGNVAADGNFLTSQATGGTSTADLALQANDMTAGGTSANTANAALSSDQRLSAEVESSLYDADIEVLVSNLTTAATGTNGSEALSANDNALLALGTGLKATNSLTTDATSSVAGDPSGNRYADINDLEGWDRAIVSNQDLDSDGDVNVLLSDPSIYLTVDGDGASIYGEVEGDSLTIDGNTLLAQGIGATSSNTLDTTAGASIASLSQAIVANQALAGSVNVLNENSDAELYTYNYVTDSSLSISDNQFGATATGLSGSNTLAMSSAAAITDDGNLFTTAGIGSKQELIYDDTSLNAQIYASLDDATVDLDVGDNDYDVTGSSLKADNNVLEAVAKGAVSSNSLSATSGAIGSDDDGVSFAVVAEQTSAAAVEAENYDNDIYLYPGYDVYGSNLSLSGNEMTATATNLTGSNSLVVDSLTLNSGDFDEFFNETGADSNADRVIFSSQAVADTGDVEAYIEDPWLEIYVEDDLQDNSSIHMDNNMVAATATVASNSNRLTNTAGTLLTSSSLISALQYSDADADAYVDFDDFDGALYVDLDEYVYDSTISISDNQVTATAAGLKATNVMDVTAGSMDGASDSYLLADSGYNEMEGFSGLSSLQEMNGDTSAEVDDLYLGTDVYYDIVDSAVHVDRNLAQASATAATASNSLSQSADTAMSYAPAQLAASQYISGDSDAYVSYDDYGWLGVYVEDEDIEYSNVSVNDNTFAAVAKGGSLTNTLDVTAGYLEHDTSGTIYANAGNQELYGFSSLSSVQEVYGDQYAEVYGMEMGVYLDDGDLDSSGIQIDNNRIQAVSVTASATNALTQQADTAIINAPALLAASQYLSADSEAYVDDSWIWLNVEDDAWDSSVSVDNNVVQAVATGGTMTNTLEVTANWLQGGDSFGGIYTDNDWSTSQEMGGNALLSSTQEFDGEAWAHLDYAGMGNEFGYDLDNSSVSVDNNLVQATSTALAANNTLNQLADTSMAEAPALLAASQELYGGSYAEVYDPWISTYVEYDVYASNLSVDNNTVQAVAVGGTMTNTLDPGAGTSMEISHQVWDPSVFPDESLFEGTYGIVSSQVSEATVAATMSGDPEISVWLEDGDLDGNSAASVSGNVSRTQATNLTADNTLITAATTDLSDATSGVLSYQNVSGDTSAITANSDIVFYGYDVEGAVKVNDNLLVAVATGGSVSNDLQVSALSMSGIPVDSFFDNYLETSSLVPGVVSGGDTQNSLLNVQERSASVSADLNDDDGDLEISAYDPDSADGSISVSRNLMAAEARGLVANNSLDVTSQTLIDGGSSALGSSQSASGDVTASIVALDPDSGFFLWVTDMSGTASLDGNTALASATSNLAINSLTASAGTQILNLGSETTASIGLPISSETVGFALQNAQSGNAAVSSSIDGIAVDNDLDSLNGTSSVDNNTFKAEARGQAAQNSLVLNAGTTLNASASLVNAQSNFGAIDSSLNNGSIGQVVWQDATGTTSVSGNKAQAVSTANLALNSMDISGTLAASDGGGTGANTATADYVALNYQTNWADVSSSVNDFSIGLNSTDDSNYATNGTASLLNNSIMASATGNSASNSFTIAAVGGTDTADFAFNGYQANYGDVSSSISGASISLSSAGGSGSFKASGNSIGATATGNVSTSSISSGL